MEYTSRSLLCILLILLATTYAGAENFRGKLAEEIGLFEEGAIRFPIDSLVGIAVGSSNDLLQGMELEISIPPELRRYRNSFALYIFRGVNPELSGTVTSYYGDRIFYSLLPTSAKMFIQLPLSNNHSLTTSPGTEIIPTVSTFEQFPIALLVIPVMKGIPPEVYTANLEMNVNPLYFARGNLMLIVHRGDTGEQVKLQEMDIRIDNAELQGVESPFQLKAGIHSISINMIGYIPETTNFTISEGSTTNLSIELIKSTPTFSIEAPTEAKIFIDGTLFEGIQGRKEEIAPGPHTVLVKIGDYSISKKIDIKEGKSYNISLFFDIFIEED